MHNRPNYSTDIPPPWARYHAQPWDGLIKTRENATTKAKEATSIFMLNRKTIDHDE